MSTTGKSDEAGDPGNDGCWKHGFNLDCGLPGTLLVEHRSRGPWAIVENVRAQKNRYYIVRLGASRPDLKAAMDGKAQVAWVGHDRILADMLIERFNGYEMARDFAPKALACEYPGGCARPMPHVHIDNGPA